MRLSKTTTILFIIGFAAIFITWFIPVVFSQEVADRLLDEDNVIEYLGALSFFVASIIFLVLFFQSKRGNRFWRIHTRRNYVHLFFALLFFFAAGEEISWAQRIIGYETPESLAEHNIQEEFTIHNLPLLDTANVDSPFRANRLFLYLWFAYGLMLPMATTLSQRLRQWVYEINIPIVPLALGILFLISYVTSKMYGILDIDANSITEIRETQQAFVFTLVAIQFLLDDRSNAKKAEAEEPRAV